MTFCMLLLVLPSNLAFTTNSPTSERFPALRLSTTASASAARSNGAPKTDEIQAFESWFSSADGSQVDSGIQHGTVGNLRGLLWNKPVVETSTKVATIPGSTVLSTDYTQDDWDSKLAMMLWKAVEEGDSSTYSGYCKLLKHGSSNDSPVSTAPHALRRWSSEQKQAFTQTASGQKLLQLEQDQTKAWRQKYNAISPPITWEQFQWAMEAVHSRAFCGVQTTSILPSVAAPIVAAGALWYAYENLPMSQIPVAAVLATAVSIIPTVLQQKKSAVLLPLIDSANHLEAADSSINFDPLKGSFELSIGPNCLVKENDGSTQLYISYGPKSKEELLLNYGFLPGVPVDVSDDEYRRCLGEQYQG